MPEIRTLKVDHLVWVDLETTGGNVEDGHVLLEVGAILTDATPDLNVLDEYNVVLNNAMGSDEWANHADPVVVEMHTKNGLWAESDQSTRFPLEVDLAICSWLDDNGIGTKHIGLGGSGVAHFDRRWIKACLPRFDRRLAYWALDVGVLRRLFMLAGRADLIAPSGDKALKPHRALDDARLHLDEARAYCAFLGAFPGATDDWPEWARTL